MSPERSPGWSRFFPRFYHLLARFDPFIRAFWHLFGAHNNLVELVVPGRRSGIPRHVLLGLLTVGESIYLGHPNGETTWTRNLEAAGGGRLERWRRPAAQVRAIRLERGPERDAVIRATWTQHIFPGNAIYKLARHHIQAVGTFYRLEPVEPVEPVGGVEGVEGDSRAIDLR